MLKPGGVVSIAVPDLLWVAEQICKTGGDLLWSEMGERTGDWGNSYTKLIHCIFGSQDNDTFQLHRSGFTAKYLSGLFTQAGFHSVKIDQIADMGMRSLVVEGIK